MVSPTRPLGFWPFALAGTPGAEKASPVVREVKVLIGHHASLSRHTRRAARLSELGSRGPGVEVDTSSRHGRSELLPATTAAARPLTPVQVGAAVTQSPARLCQRRHHSVRRSDPYVNLTLTTLLPLILVLALAPLPRTVTV